MADGNGGMKRNKFGCGLSRLLALLLFAAAAGMAHAQTWPSKPIRIICPFPPGGIADIYGRLIAQRLSDTWGQPVVVENRTGAGGNIGAEALARAAPDGYTLGFGSIGTHAINPTISTKLPYDPIKDFAPIALVLDAEGVLVVHPSVPAHSVAELIALARASPGKLTYGSAGMGTASHLAGELFKSMARVDVTHIPYKGNVPAIADLLGGQINMMFATMPTVLPHVKSGKLKSLAVIGARRSTALPELPTLAEAALPGFEVNNWIALFAPAGTPREIVARLNAEVLKIMQSPEIQQRLPADGARFLPTTPEEFGAFVKSEIAKWAPVLKAAGVKAD
jgi:tripartite-type tricarboxylate transporter receptor subunit TctC